ncbi:UDP-N-acetylmuramoyl-L-alanyl-D-glutamate--2,6-diaminopimelate ligase [Corynebacterium bovis]|uniref:UDP-N-acetylmuramoyl-L-alanyl-D-glutamate--2, 6-diaminopimelate ligase n=1 Tax=Corynebacterium bovis TaxID=36808 RepID=UPI002549C8F4|nr:UDP-N-acetylmuramoyl-L-alanyl-D-glutamate--2,6-diaminopimelate ligase [Corynebacterium bovis]MDK8510453.1 UDP-N-acetylmuramoyl-L-alanyl-D-glutamate--2,6-diaminopimelate ligase [Corynebacterium bovis]
MTHQDTPGARPGDRGATLRDLAALTGGRVVGDADTTVTSAAIAASDVDPGGLFAAVPGTRVHGASYAAQSAGAAVLTDAAGLEIITGAAGEGAGAGEVPPVLVVDDCRRWMGPVAAEIYGHPSRGMTVIGVTGTSGKTTTSYLIERGLMESHHVGLIGTTGTRINGRPVPTSLTTPEAPTMQALLARMRDEGVTHVVMEVSSHALSLGRVRGIAFDVAGFTNLSRDHLDFHPTMEDYFLTKASLFTGGTDGSDGTGGTDGDGQALPAAVVCVDDDWGRRLAGMLDDPVTVATTDHGRDGAATWTVTGVDVAPSGGQRIHVRHLGTEAVFGVALPGLFNVANATLALACLVAAGEPATIAGVLSDVQVPGRMQAVDAGQDFMAVVDYAHKPAAVAAVVGTLAEHLERAGHGGRVGVVIGAGGNRDAEKRPEMGAEAARRADAVIVTDDNPRDEDPATIRAAVEAGARTVADERRAAGDGDVTVLSVGDRAEAIARAVAWARPGDALVVAGKGHEKGQLIAGTVHDFDDVEVLRTAIGSRMTAREANS